VCEDAPSSAPAGRSACRPDQVRGQGAFPHTRGEGSCAAFCSLKPSSLTISAVTWLIDIRGATCGISSGLEHTRLMNVACGPNSELSPMIKREATRTVRRIQPLTGDFQRQRPHRSARRRASGIRGTERYGIFWRSLRPWPYAPGNPGRSLRDFAPTRPEPGFPVVPKRSGVSTLM